MPKPRANEDFNLHPGIWRGYIVDEFLRPKRREIPSNWGGNSSQRYANAVFLAIVCIQTSNLETPKAVVERGLNLPSHLCRQFGFAYLFAKAPDFFIELVQFVRSRGTDQARIEMVARELHFRGDELVLDSRGEKRRDKEIAAELDRIHNLEKSIHPSVVGKARCLLAKMKSENTSNRLERYRDFDYDETIRR